MNEQIEVLWRDLRELRVVLTFLQRVAAGDGPPYRKPRRRRVWRHTKAGLRWEWSR